MIGNPPWDSLGAVKGRVDASPKAHLVEPNASAIRVSSDDASLGRRTALKVVEILPNRVAGIANPRKQL